MLLNIKWFINGAWFWLVFYIDSLWKYLSACLIWMFLIRRNSLHPNESSHFSTSVEHFVFLFFVASIPSVHDWACGANSSECTYRCLQRSGSAAVTPPALLGGWGMLGTLTGAAEVHSVALGQGAPLDDWLCGAHQRDRWNAFRWGSKSSQSSYINHCPTGKCQVINVAWKSSESHWNTRRQGRAGGSAT